MTSAPSVFTGTPVHNHWVHCDYTFSLLQTMRLLEAQGVKSTVSFAPGSSLTQNRAVLVGAALESGMSHLLCVDADMGWPPQAILRLLAHKRDLIGCACPMNGSDRMEVNDPEPVEDVPDLWEVSIHGAGILLISRACLLRMEEHWPGCAFAFEHDGRVWIGEDYTFCVRWRSLGGRVYTDTKYPIRHHCPPSRDFRRTHQGGERRG